MLMAISPVLRRLRFPLRKILGLIPTPLLLRTLSLVATQKARTVAPADGLRFLLGLDAALYPVQGELAVAYGGGIHTKHRHMGYHDFFVERIHPGDRVLDIGCGIGAVAFDLADKAGAEVLGVDLSPENIAVAKEWHAHPHVNYIVGDVLESLPAGEFDAVVLSNVLEHLPGRPDFLARLAQATHAQRTLIRVPLFERDWRVPLKQELGVEWRLDSTHETEFTQESFAAEIEAAGFRIEEQEIRWGEIWAVAVPDEST